MLPIDRCSRRIVPRLRREGYPVTDEDLAGGHVVPGPVVRRAAAWLTGPTAGPVGPVGPGT